MDFSEVLESVLPKLDGIARQLERRLSYGDHDDLLQEMFIHLWKKWKRGELEGKSKSYLVQGCWFYVKNYVRTAAGKARMTSIDEPKGVKDTTLKEILPDTAEPLTEMVHWHLVIEKVKTGWLTKQEQKVFDLCLEGYTLREIGKEIGVSYVRVAKIRKNIEKKYRKIKSEG